ncbi:Glutamyl-tRNA(Gln) amidotransferase subunit A [Hordeum vulgare]|nr:Glutamyl-tRNA(Gln) amidotransferase subunit A [Hordeum vulgare]
MNFNDARTCQHAQDLAPPPRLVTDEDRQEHCRRQRRLLIAEADEQAMAESRQRYPQDIANENTFWAKRRANRRAERTVRRQRKALAISQCDLR